MFYAEEPSRALRFGDVVRGFVAATPKVDRPRLEVTSDENGSSFSLLVSQSPFSVILSPCCSIGDKVLSLAPLVKILPSFLKNPYFSEDLTRINRQMEPEQTVAPDVWAKLPDAEQEKRRATGLGYALVEYFIFASHDLLPTYSIKSKEKAIELNTYMVDFRRTYQIQCSTINTPADSPLDAKYLELTATTRKELREKIAYYYGRTPQEDTAALAVA